MSWMHSIAGFFRRVSRFMSQWPDLDRAEREAEAPKPPPSMTAVELSREREIDESLEESFPASDPPAHRTR